MLADEQPTTRPGASIHTGSPEPPRNQSPCKKELSFLRLTSCMDVQIHTFHTLDASLPFVVHGNHHPLHFWNVYIDQKRCGHPTLKLPDILSYWLKLLQTTLHMIMAALHRLDHGGKPIVKWQHILIGSWMVMAIYQPIRCGLVWDAPHEFTKKKAKKQLTCWFMLMLLVDGIVRSQTRT